jgi:3-oxoadipate enol-lactonase
LSEEVEAPPWEEMERLWEAKDWEALAELETKVWVDGWGQPSDRVDEGLRRKVHGWILSSMKADKPEGRQQRLDPPAAERLGDLEIPTLVLIGQVDEPAAVVAERHLGSSVAGAQVVEFPGVAHMIHLEEPERFNELVLEFLAACASKPALI